MRVQEHISVSRRLCAILPLFVLVIDRLTVPALAQSARTSGGSCDVQSGFELKSVTPLWEVEVDVQGCYSRNTSDGAQEVHVIHLKEVEGSPPPLVVSLHVKPAAENSVHGGPIVLVLFSEFSVSWRILAERLSNDTRHRIVVSKGSQVIENRDIQVTIQRKDTGRIKHLLAWTIKRHKALTSYAKVESANNIYLKVGGSDERAPRRCDIKSKNTVPNVVGFIQEVVPISQRQGCVTKPQAQRSGASQRIVNVVKIHETSLTSIDGKPDSVGRVMVHLGTRSRRMINRDVALVLQAPLPVEWVLTIDGVAGRVDVIAEGKVVTPRSVSSQRVAVRAETLPETVEELLSHARDWFGPSYAFTEVWKANGVRVFVDDSDTGVKQVQASRDAPGGDPVAAHRVRATDRKEHSRRGGDTHLNRDQSDAHVPVSGRQTAPAGTNDVIRMPNVMLTNAMEVECLAQHMRVSFPRLTLDQLGLQQRDITLTDTHCAIGINETHYVLSSPFHGCGTKREVDDGHVVYSNSVHFHFHVHKLSSGAGLTLRRSSGSTPPVDDEDNSEEGSGNGNGNGGTPSSEPSRSESRTLPFKCEYKIPIEVKEEEKEPPASRLPTRDATTLTAARELFSLDIYRDPSYVRSVTPTEYPFVAHEHDTLYVETKLGAGPVMQVVNEECWLSTSDEPLARPVVILLKSMCPVKPTTKLEAASDTSGGRFSFPLESDYSVHPLLFLHCKLGVCAAEADHSTKWGLELCVDPRDFCQSESLRAYLESPRGTHHSIFTRGPFQVKKRSPAASGNPFSQTPIRQKQAQQPDQTARKMDAEMVGGIAETIDVRCTVPEQQQQSIIILGLSTEAVIGIAFASFIIGIALSAVLWCIYMKTDPLRTVHRRPTHNFGYDLSAHSGSSTPSSQSPMTA